MILKTIVVEDFTNYKLPSMFISTSTCTFKCCTEGGYDISVCQNSPLAQQPNIDISNEQIYNMYINNPITKAIVIAGFEPFDQFDEVMSLIYHIRSNGCMDDIVIYTGYYPNELELYLMQLKQVPNIVIKFGRYKQGNKPHYDKVLGVELISDNQYAERIS